MANDLLTVTGSPEKAGTLAERNRRATQPPTAVPARSPETWVLVARPLGMNVTDTLPLPVGPSAVLQLPAFPAAAPSAALAAFVSNGGAELSTAGAAVGLVAAASDGFSVGLVAASPGFVAASPGLALPAVGDVAAVEAGVAAAAPPVLLATWGAALGAGAADATSAAEGSAVGAGGVSGLLVVAATVGVGAGGVPASLPEKNIAAAPPPMTSTATRPIQTPAPPFLAGAPPALNGSCARTSGTTVTGALKSGAAKAEPNEPVPTLAIELGLESLPIKMAASSCFEAAF